MENINRNSNSGGANTNINGLNNEKEIDKDFTNLFDTIEKKKNHSIVTLDGKTYEKPKKHRFRKYMKDDINKNVKPAHGCKEPDACLINNTTSPPTVYIFEAKYQCQPGSVCEKLQTGVFKRDHYSKLILIEINPIHFFYLLNLFLILSYIKFLYSPLEFDRHNFSRRTH